MFYVLEAYSQSIIDDYNAGELTPLGYALDAYCRSVAQDINSLAQRS